MTSQAEVNTKRKPQKEITLLASHDGEKKKWAKDFIYTEAPKCPKLGESDNKENLLRQLRLCIYCASHKKKGEDFNKRKTLKCDICKE